MRKPKTIYGTLKFIMLTVFMATTVWTTEPCRAQDTLLVTGNINAGRNHHLSGVSVSMEGVYTLPAFTDENGDFQVVAPSGNVWLILAPAEKYKSRRVYLNNRTNISIQMTENTLVSGYDEVIDLYQPTLRRNFISAYSAPDLGNANLLPYLSEDQYLQGNIPGLFVTARSGMPGSGTTSWLRGIRSMYTNNQPLYVVDGLPMEPHGLLQSTLDGNDYNPLSSLDPNDITNITILKDYNSTAAFGICGSNGVILIETLKPTEVRTTIDFFMRTGISFQPEQLPQLNANQYKTLANELLISSGLPEEEFSLTYPALYSTPNSEEYYRYNHNTNWQDKIFSNGLMNDFYIRVRGGDEIARYGLSVGYLNHKGIIDQTYFNRFNVRFVGTFNIFQWMRMYISSNLTNSNAELRESARIRQTSPILASLFKSPLLIPYQFDEEGNRLETLEEVGPLGVSNPLAIIQKFEGRDKNFRFATSFRNVCNISRGIHINSLFGLTLNTLNEGIFMPNTGMELYYDNEAYNVSESFKNYLYSIYTDHNLSFSREFNNKHSVRSAAGFMIWMNTFQIDWGLAKNSHERDEYKQLQNGINYLREMGGENAKWNRIAFYGKTGYSYKSKYFIDAGLMIENSTRVGKNAEDVLNLGGRPFGLFYSIGGAWRLSSESFLKNMYWLEDLKIRLSYGLAGNDDIGNLSAWNYYTLVHYRGTTGIVPGPILEENIKFEVNKQWNAGLDLSLWGDKLGLAIDLYRIRTEDLLVFEPQPSLIGFTTIPANNGELLNRGWEVAVFARILDKESFKWDAGFNLSKFKNSVEQIKDDQVVTPFLGGEFISRVGEPVLSFYGYLYEGVYSTMEEADLTGFVTETGIPYGAGDAKFKDLSGPDGLPDGVINEYDKTIIGSPIPELYGGLHNHFTFGRWSLDVGIQFVTGREVYNYLRNQNEKMADLSNQSANVLKRWFTEGQLTDVPRAVWDDPVGNAAFSTRWIEDGSYLRLKNLTLAYTIPEKMFFFRNAQFYATATNLYTWNRYLGYDPEFSFSHFTMEQGIDYGLMPHTRQFMFGIKLGL